MNTTTGAQDIVSQGGNFVDPGSLAIATNGDILISDANVGSGAIIRVDPQTGAQSIVTSGGGLSDPAGIAIYPTVPRLIDFETFPGGQPASPSIITNQFSSVGLEFSGGAQLLNVAVYYGTGQNYAVWKQSAGTTGTLNYSMTLTTDPQDVTFDLTGNISSVFDLQAYDAAGGLISSGSISRQPYVYAQPGTGTLFRRETIRIRSTNGVRRIDFNEQLCLCGHIVDNVRF